jgi:hypothetical protein
LYSLSQLLHLNDISYFHHLKRKGDLAFISSLIDDISWQGCGLAKTRLWVMLGIYHNNDFHPVIHFQIFIYKLCIQADILLSPKKKNSFSPRLSKGSLRVKRKKGESVERLACFNFTTLGPYWSFSLAENLASGIIFYMIHFLRY